MERRRRAVLVAVLVGILVAVPLVLAEPRPGAPSAAPVAPVPLTAAAGAYVGTHLASPFYAAVFSDPGLPTAKLAALGAYFNTTPIGWFRFGGNGTAYDPTTATDWVPPAGGGRYAPVAGALWNLTWFRSWCLARTPACAWLAFLPGEINDTAAAVATATWYHATLGLAPSAWEFGNEPAGWTHFGVPYANWSTADAVPVTPAGYAAMAASYRAAVTARYPADRFVGIEAGCGCDYAVTQAAAAALGSDVASYAFHAFPSSTAGASSPSELLGALSSPTNLSTEAARFRAAVAAGCPGCGAVPIDVGAYQAGPVPALSPLLGSYPSAVFLAASVVQAIDVNASSFTVYSSASLFNATSGAATPEGLLYQRILANLSMGADYAVRFGTGAPDGVSGLLVVNGSTRSVFLVNANATVPVALTIDPSLWAAGAPGSVWTWGPDETVPVAAPSGPLPGSVRVPAEGIALIVLPGGPS